MWYRHSGGQWSSVVTSGLLVALLALLTPSLVVIGAVNVSSVALAHAVDCSLSYSLCSRSIQEILPVVWKPPNRRLQVARKWLRRVLILRPDMRRGWLRLAEIDFALGRRERAAAVMLRGGYRLRTSYVPDSHRHVSPIGGGSRLTMPLHYESALMGAYQYRREEDWERAVQAFRWAISLGAEYLTSQDYAAYFEALAHTYVNKVDQDVFPARAAVWAGVYFYRASRWHAAVEWLARARRLPGWADLRPEEQARGWAYLGLVYEHQGKEEAARRAYRRAISIAPTWRIPRLFYMAFLTRRGETKAVSRQAQVLSTLGPTYRLGRQGRDRKRAEPLSLSPGEPLVGYDVDDGLLAAGGPVDLWLWWRHPRRTVSGRQRGWGVGDFWVQRQTIVNLAPNPGFAWGAEPDGRPVGFSSVYATTSEKGTSLAEVWPGGRAQRALQLESPGIVGIKSFPFRVDGKSLYLMAGWLWRGGRRVSLGRHCFPADHPADEWNQLEGRPGGLVDETTVENEILGEWVYVAWAGPPHPTRPVAVCQVYVETQGGTALFRELIFAKLGEMGKVGNE